MIQKRSCSLSTKANLNIYCMIKTMIYYKHNDKLCNLILKHHKVSFYKIRKIMVFLLEARSNCKITLKPNAMLSITVTITVITLIVDNGETLEMFFARYADGNTLYTYSSNMQTVLNNSSRRNRKTLSMVFCKVSRSKCGEMSPTK